MAALRCVRRPRDRRRRDRRDRPADGGVAGERGRHDLDAQDQAEHHLQRRHALRRRGRQVQLGAHRRSGQQVDRPHRGAVHRVDGGGRPADPGDHAQGAQRPVQPGHRSAARHNHRLPQALQADAAAFADKPVGAGPFVVTEFIRQNKITFERNPDYWNAPRPYIDKLEIVLLQDDVQRFNALQSGQATMITDNSNANVNQQAKDAGFEVPDIEDKVAAFFWMINTAAPPVQRRAGPSDPHPHDRQAERHRHAVRGQRFPAGPDPRPRHRSTTPMPRCRPSTRPKRSGSSTSTASRSSSRSS